jgi:hypothetical protein
MDRNTRTVGLSGLPLPGAAAYCPRAAAASSGGANAHARCSLQPYDQCATNSQIKAVSAASGVVSVIVFDASACPVPNLVAIK